MESFAAENRRFKSKRWPKKWKNRPYFDEFGRRWPSLRRTGPAGFLHGRPLAGRYKNNNNNLKKTTKKHLKRHCIFEAVEAALRSRRKKVDKILQCVIERKIFR